LTPTATAVAVDFSFTATGRWGVRCDARHA
jgi:hypothetical protein